MSVTVVAAPLALGYVMVTSLVSVITPVVVGNVKKTIEARQNEEYVPPQLEYDVLDVTPEQIEQICKEYDTLFADRELLMKTLKEHGVEELMVRDDDICAKIDKFNLVFSRQEETEQYKLKIYLDEECDEKELMSDLALEYAANSQQDAYDTIVKRLEAKNLEIEEEELLEDDSIVLTINLG